MASAAGGSWHWGGPDSDLDMPATEFVWCPGDETFPLCAPLSFSLLLVSSFCPPSFPCLWTPKAQTQPLQPTASEQLVRNKPCQGRTDANPVASA